MPPQTGWKDEVADIKSALGWVLQNADTYQIDPNKINVMGNRQEEISLCWLLIVWGRTVTSLN